MSLTQTAETPDLETTYPALTKTLTYLEEKKRSELIKEVDKLTGEVKWGMNEEGARRISDFATQARKDNESRELKIRRGDNEPVIIDNHLNLSNRDWVRLLRDKSILPAISGLCDRIRNNIFAAPKERRWANGTTIWTDICPEAITAACNAPGDSKKAKEASITQVSTELLALIKDSLPMDIAETVKGVEIGKPMAGNGMIVVSLDMRPEQAE